MKVFNFKCIFLFSLIIVFFNTYSQEKVQTIRGRVIDAITKTGLPGANVVLKDTSRFLGTAADENGYFKLENVPIGRRIIKISFVGYKEKEIQLVLHSAKETIIEVQLEEKCIETREVEIKANRDKTKANNEMSYVSSRLFTIEETERYAGSRGDPARMAMNFAGVSGANDQRNDIIIRGNSPAGLLWKLEDVEIPNPNHFASAGSTGGPVSILNNNVLTNSDFMTGAFPAEYGNALSGVFDLKMRAGNYEKHEFTAQTGFNGLELGVEGPINRRNHSSYIANYRYSTLDFMEKIGFDFGVGGVPRYQDATWKLNFPFKNSVFSFFGIGGRSQIAVIESKNKSSNENNMYTDELQDLYNGSDLFASAVTFTRFINNRHYLKFILSGFYDKSSTRIDTLDTLWIPHLFVTDYTSNSKVSASIIDAGKMAPKISYKTGLQYDLNGYEFKTTLFDKTLNTFRIITDDKVFIQNGYGLIKSFAQLQIKFYENLSFFPGVHFLYHELSQKNSLEPRCGVSYCINNDKLSVGYGLHSRTQSMYTYLLKTYYPDGSYQTTNKELGLTKAHHFVISYDKLFTDKFHIKTEAYYQMLFNVPVESKASSWSILNSGASWGTDAQDSLVNKGTGKNLGLEITIERFFCNNYYFLFTSSIFDSKYKGSDGIERNTAFNGTYVFNLLFGKEFPLKNDKLIFFDIKSTFAGGKRYTPIDLEKSKLRYETVYETDKAFSKQYPPYFKTDVKIGYRVNKRKATQEWLFYVENITNHKNVLLQTYSKMRNEIKTIYQLGIFPMLQWRIYF